MRVVTNISGRQFLAVALATLTALCSSPDLFAQAAAQRAGQVAAYIPTGQIERPSGAQPAEVGTGVLWDDLVTTAARGRVRITLDDGSILNVGSNASLRVIKHEAASQQSELVLTFGEMRVRTQLRQPNASFTVRTNTAVLGVIGTDFWVRSLPTQTLVIVFEGALRVTSLVPGLGSVVVGAGQQTAVGVNQPPASPSSPSATDYQNAIDATNVGEPLPEPPGPRPSRPGLRKLDWIAFAVAAGVVLAIGLSTSGGGKKAAPPPPKPPPPPPP